MHLARIAELLEPFLGPAAGQRLTANDLNHISTYIDLLLRWNARINLTAIRDPEEIVTRHFGESFFAAIHLFPHRDAAGHAAGSIEPHVGTAAPGCPPERSSAAVKASAGLSASDRPEPALSGAKGPTANDAVTLADLGSGAGFPGIPIKLWAPKISLTLIESNHKKATFLREVTRTLTLTNVNILTARAEQLLQEQQQRKPASTFAAVTLRAVERFANVLPVAASLVSPGGRLALLVGRPQIDQACSLLPNLTWDSPLPVPQSNSRILLIGHQSQQ